MKGDHPDANPEHKNSHAIKSKAFEMSTLSSRLDQQWARRSLTDDWTNLKLS
jgi:hypothetical protein